MAVIEETGQVMVSRYLVKFKFKFEDLSALARSIDPEGMDRVLPAEGVSTSPLDIIPAAECTVHT